MSAPPVATPRRLQLSRRKGFNLQAHSREVNGLEAVNCARPSRHGNPYYPGCHIGYGGFDEHMRPVHADVRDPNVQVAWFRIRVTEMQQHEAKRYEKYIAPLRGKNCACWCDLCPVHENGKPLGFICTECPPCHADVLLEIANR